MSTNSITTSPGSQEFSPGTLTQGEDEVFATPQAQRENRNLTTRKRKLGDTSPQTMEKKPKDDLCPMVEETPTEVLPRSPSPENLALAAEAESVTPIIPTSPVSDRGITSPGKNQSDVTEQERVSNPLNPASDGHHNVSKPKPAKTKYLKKV